MAQKLGPGEIDMQSDQDINPEVTDLSTVPELIKRGVNVGSILQAENLGKTSDTAAKGYHTVAEATPGKITVYRPNEYTPYVRNHEMTHELQQTRDVGGIKLPGNNTIDLPGQVKSYSPQQYRPGDPRNYSYGGQDALLAARGKKTIADFNLEQQADIVADYKDAQDAIMAKIQSGNYTQEDLKNWHKTYDAYHPFVEQLANVPAYSAKRSIGTLLGVGTPDAPPVAKAPGLPPADTPGLGYVQPDPVLGGQAAPLKPTGGVARALKPVLAKYKNPEDEPPAEAFKRNQPWSKQGSYVTKLSPAEEQEFQQWAKANKVPWKDSPTADYDMRGYWKAFKEGKVKQSLSKFDHTMHFPDTWKTPYDAVFSRESMYARPDAPQWVGDKLVAADGTVIADETPQGK